MTNKELSGYMQEFINLQNDREKDEWYCTKKDITEGEMEAFCEFLNEKGIRISLEERK